eukprot:TRINITY_DN11429_c0_g1_i6.p2 TRINITY_DN11429_c0_g1~~TRINITY_DN11429_c0_g1_i6.p2  ORF type:complete len:238 (-),score=30.75 TRINITY_DN11429_c0_g1_i6:247-960(-)
MSDLEGNVQIGTRPAAANVSAAPEPSAANPEKRPGTDNILPESMNLSKATHPTACVFTVAFKIAAIVCYFLVDTFTIGNSSLSKILTIIFSAFDFWTVKNVTGRLLVGLRWWSKIKNDGDQDWIFECRLDESKINTVDKTFFWGGQIGFTAAWLIIFVVNSLSFKFTVAFLDGYVLVLLGINLFAYYKCSNEKQKQAKEFASSASKAAAKHVITKRLFGDGKKQTNLQAQHFCAFKK